MAMPTFDYSSWAAFEPAFNEHIKSGDWEAAGQAARALRRLLVYGDPDQWTGLPPEPVAHALLGALRRHAEDRDVQLCGCRALYRLCEKFSALRGTLQRDPSVLATVRAASKVKPDLEQEDRYTKELCVWLQPPQAEEQGRHQSGYAVTVSGGSSHGTNSPQHQGEPHLAAAPAVQQPAKEAAASKAEKSVELEPGHGARLAMFSARFNAKNKDTENKFRAVKKLLVENHYEVLMVDAGAGESFGKLTAQYLNRLNSEKGIMLAVCTSDYGEMTDSPYSSFAELEYAQEYKLDVLPLQVEQQWKPNPPCGEGHQDTEKLALAYISMVFKPSRVRVDCRNKSIEEIACEIAAVLRRGTRA